MVDRYSGRRVLFGYRVNTNEVRMIRATRDKAINELAETVASKLMEDPAVLHTFLVETLRFGFFGYVDMENDDLLRLYQEELNRLP